MVIKKTVMLPFIVGKPTLPLNSREQIEEALQKRPVKKIFFLIKVSDESLKKKTHNKTYHRRSLRAIAIN